MRREEGGGVSAYQVLREGFDQVDLQPAQNAGRDRAPDRFSIVVPDDRCVGEAAELGEMDIGERIFDPPEWLSKAVFQPVHSTSSAS